METLISRLKSKYQDQIKEIKTVDKAEISITIKSGIDAPTFSQDLQDHLVEIVDELTIVQVNVLAEDGKVLDSFSTNQ